MTDYTSNSKRFCSVFKSSKKAEMYVYVDRAKGLEAVPEALLASFGQPSHVMDLVLTPEKKLARADAANVLDQIAENGFYLQMPPPEGEGAIENAVPAPKDSLNG